MNATCRTCHADFDGLAQCWPCQRAGLLIEEQRRPHFGISKDRQARFVVLNTGAGSARFGPCEVCGKTGETLWHLIEERRYSEGWTRHECRSLFGHFDCLQRAADCTLQTIKCNHDLYSVEIDQDFTRQAD